MRSTVEPYAEHVEALVRDGVEMQTIWQRLRDDYGYTGSYSSVRRYVQRVYPKEPEVVCRVETEPGEEAQVDFVQRRSAMGCEKWTAAKSLGVHHDSILVPASICRMCFRSDGADMDPNVMNTPSLGLGGVVRRVVIDNLKAGGVALRICTIRCWGTPYRRLAEHYGFVISPNRPRTPPT